MRERERGGWSKLPKHAYYYCAALTAVFVSLLVLDIHLAQGSLLLHMSCSTGSVTAHMYVYRGGGHSMTACQHIVRLHWLSLSYMQAKFLLWYQHMPQQPMIPLATSLLIPFVIHIETAEYVYPHLVCSLVYLCLLLRFRLELQQRSAAQHPMCVRRAVGARGVLHREVLLNSQVLSVLCFACCFESKSVPGF